MECQQALNNLVLLVRLLPWYQGKRNAPMQPEARACDNWLPGESVRETRRRKALKTWYRNDSGNTFRCADDNAGH